MVLRGAKYHLTQKIKLGLQREADSFRCSTLVMKLYKVSFILGAICAISFVIALTVDLLLRSGPTQSLKVLSLALLALPMAFAAAARILELYPRVHMRTSFVLGSSVGKFGLPLFTALISFVADWYVRNEIYEMTGENPEAFTSARIALAVPFTIIVLVCTAALLAYVDVLTHPVMAVTRNFIWWLSSLLFGARHPPPEFQFTRFVGSLGIWLFLIFILMKLTYKPQLEPNIEWLVVKTGFYQMSNGRYPKLQTNSSVAFLPGDRVCVAELLPNGKFNFRTVPRAIALGSGEGD